MQVEELVATFIRTPKQPAALVSLVMDVHCAGRCAWSLVPHCHYLESPDSSSTKGMVFNFAPDPENHLAAF